MASMFSQTMNDELTLQEKERMLNETVCQIKKDSLDFRNRNATDIQELQQIVKEQAELQKLHISL